MKTIRNKFMLFTCIQLTLAVFAVLTVSYAYFYNTIIGRYEGATDQTLGQISDGLNLYFTDVNNMSIAFHYVKDIKDYFYSNTLDEKENDQIEKHTRVYLNAIVDMKEGLDGIYLIKGDGSNPPKSVDRMDKNQYSDYLYSSSIDWAGKIPANGYVVLLHKKGDSNIPVISFARRYLNINLKNKYLGFSIIDIEPDVVESILNQVKASITGQICIVDRSGNYVYNSDRTLIGKPFDNQPMLDMIRTKNKAHFLIGSGKDKQLVSVKDCSAVDWTVISIMPWGLLTRNISSMRNSIFIIGISFAIFSMLVSSMFSLKITDPLKQLRKQMEKVKQGNFDEVKVKLRTVDEVGELSRDFISMTDNIKQLIVQIKEEQIKKRAAEFKALQSQINPHFLFNTLDSIVWMIAAGKGEESIKMVSSLANMLRISLNEGKEFVSVKSELEHLDNYVAIQKMRYGPKLNVRFAIDPCVYGVIMPKLLLQPLVENSIYHGIKLKKGIGHIKIVGIKKDDKVIFKIIDDGVGMGRDMLNKLENASSESSQSYGVANVNDRIKLQYGPEFGLKYYSKPGKGTMAVVTLPFKSEGEFSHV